MTTPFLILTIGWSPSYIRKIVDPIQKHVDIAWCHGIVGDPEKIERIEFSNGRQSFPLSPPKNRALPPADLNFLAAIEAPDVPSVRNMILGDRVLNRLPADTALAYASFLGKRIEEVIRRTNPDLVLATFDSLHSCIALAVSRKLGVPWVSMVYTAIPPGRTAFSTKMNPNALLPITRERDEQLHKEAQEIIDGFCRGDARLYQNVALNDVRFTIRRLGMHLENLIRRFTTEPEEGRDPYTWPTAYKRLADIVRRTWNGYTLPKRNFIQAPPQEDYAYYPLHMQPESSVDNWAPFYQDQFALALQVLRALPANCSLVVKLHYIDPDNYGRALLKEFLKLPGVRIADPLSSSRRFLERAKLVIGIQGTACLEAGLLGKPTLVFGDSPYQYFPNTERPKDVNELQEQIKRLINKAPPSDLETKESLAAYIARFQYGSCNDWAKSPTALESENLAKLFNKLVAYFRSTRAAEPERTAEFA